MKDESMTLENCAFVRKKKKGSRDTFFCVSTRLGGGFHVCSRDHVSPRHAAQIMFVTPSIGEPEFLCPGAET